MKRARGFTLLELIVVIAIFGVMSVMAYGGLASVLQTRVRVQQSMQRTAELQKAYIFLRNDFQQVRNRPARDNFGDLQPAFLGNRLNQVTFTRGGWNNPLSQPRSSLERVAYHYDEKNDVLVRSSYRVLDLAQDSKPVDAQLLTQVEEIHWRYLDPSTRTWMTTWPVDTQTNVLAATVAPPLAVELKLTTKDLGELRFLFRLGLEPLPNGLGAGYVAPGSGAQVAAPPQGSPQTGNPQTSPGILNGLTPPPGTTPQ
ncbi:MAG: type II secretion system minor pseudopilin GspJ [Stenotrophobium sp.]